MDWNLFIIPITLIVVELVKKSGINSRWLPFLAVGFGGIFGVIYAAILPAPDAIGWLHYIIGGLVYGASASGIYDAGKSALPQE